MVPYKVTKISKRYVYVDETKYIGDTLYASEEEAWSEIIAYSKVKIKDLDYLRLIEKRLEFIKTDKPHLFL